MGAGLAAVMPLVARERLHVSPTGFGVLAASLGLGSVSAVWLMPRMGAAQHPERALFCSAVVWSGGTALFAGAGVLWVGSIGLLLAGGGTMGVLNVLFSNYTLQLSSWMRGRGSAIAMLMVWLGTSIGAVGWGVLASGIGVRDSLLAAAAVNLVVAALAPALLPVRGYSGPSPSVASSVLDSGSSGS